MKFSEVKGCENLTVMFAKFTKSEHAQDLLDGNLYMNNFKHFVKQEENSKHKGQGDSYEGAFVTTFDAVDIYVNDGYAGYAQSGKISMTYTDLDRSPLFSMSMLKSCDFKVIEDKGSSIVLKVDFSEQDIKEFKENFKSDTVVFTLNFKTLIERLNDAARKTETKRVTGPVEYVDFSIMDSKHKDRYKRFEEGYIDFLFHKHNSLKYQREFRLILPDIQVDRNYTFEVGSLEDIFYVVDIDEFFSGMKIELGLKKANSI
ncbi:hypothetical protein ACSS31_27615 (plasmid) [Priestia megaterium]